MIAAAYGCVVMNGRGGEVALASQAVTDAVDLPSAACICGEFRGAPDAEVGPGMA